MHPAGSKISGNWVFLLYAIFIDGSSDFAYELIYGFFIGLERVSA